MKERPPAKTPNLERLAARIAKAWLRGIKGILDVGDLLAKARGELADDQWAALLVLLPFGPQHARRLVRIGNCDWLRPHVGALPSDIETLDRLTGLSAERRDELLEADAIHPGMARGDLDTLSKADARAAKERDLGARTEAANAELAERGKLRKYNVIYADPPWRFETFSVKGKRKSADNHYQTMPTEAIKSLAFGGLAATDCVLFLWATAPMLPEALEVLDHWGFAYKSQFVWLKPKAATGFWNRNRHELLLIGTRGAIPAPAPGYQVDSVLEAAADERLAHSEKPASARAMIEA
ncbi:MAG: MT-A70 family methyltransferase [Alphaproteobacteria bacterium]